MIRIAFTFVYFVSYRYPHLIHKNKNIESQFYRGGAGLL
jgi:hypothetical protein